MVEHLNFVSSSAISLHVRPSHTHCTRIYHKTFTKVFPRLTPILQRPVFGKRTD